MAPILDKIEDDLMQLTLQLRNRKDDDKKYAKFHGDSLIGVSLETFAFDIGTEMCTGSSDSSSWPRWRSEGHIHPEKLVCSQKSVQWSSLEEGARCRSSLSCMMYHD